jgi:hypothetical protein
MNKNEPISERLDRFARRNPAVIWSTNIVLMLFVTLLLLMETDAPVVLYQAF